MTDPFDARALADWSADALRPLFIGNDTGKHWRMLEYWWQVELFRRPPVGATTVGTYELPYRTALAHRSRKLGAKWSDLVYLAGTDVLVVELKDLGCASATITKNAQGVGLDLAALASLDARATAVWWHRLGAGAQADVVDDHARDRAVRDQARQTEYRIAAALADGATRWRGAIVTLARDTTRGAQLHDEFTRGYAKAASKITPTSALPPADTLRRATTEIAPDVYVLVVETDVRST